jgi:hypothetical protein
LLDICFIREDHVILRDVDGNEVSLTAMDAFTLMCWLEKRQIELLQTVAREQEEKEKHNGLNEV